MRLTLSSSFSAQSGRFVVAAGLALIIGSSLWLIATGNGEARYSADHDGTVPLWFRWIPALVGIALVRLVPTVRSPIADTLTAKQRTLYVEALTLLSAAVLFAVSLRSLGGGEPAHSLLKLPLLLGVPLLLFWTLRGRAGGLPTGSQHGKRMVAFVPVAAWLALTYASPLKTPLDESANTLDFATLAATVIVGFLINSLLEEVFYRRWLQTRWEAMLGRWPGIVLSALLWASWHVGIQGTGNLPVDLAMVFANHGALGLFLGYLWSTYRVMWPPVAVHGALNAAPLLLALG